VVSNKGKKLDRYCAGTSTYIVEHMSDTTTQFSVSFLVMVLCIFFIL
jgi:hypothetical protein